MTDVRTFLIAQNLIAPHDVPNSQGQFRITCPNCSHHNQKCYVDGAGRGVICFHCKFSKTWRGFQRQYEPPTPQEVAMEQYVATCATRLQSDTRLMQYFSDRGITEETVKALRLGYCDTTSMYAPSPIDIELKLAFNNGSWFLHDRIIIPYIRDGIVVAVRGRLHPDMPEGPGVQKYMTLTGTNPGAYYPSEIDTDEPVVITEGEFDAIILRQNGIQAIGFPGAKNANVRLLDGIKHLYIAFDGDDAGREGADNFIKHVAEVRRIDLPEGYDVSEYVGNFGVDSFRTLIEKAVFYLYGRPQKEDRFAAIVDGFQDWSWTNGELLGPRMGEWAPRLEKMLSGWQPGLILIGAEAHCLAKGTKVMMFDGTSRCVEDIVVGDRLMGPDSMPRTVKSTCAGIAPLHRVRSKDGSMDYTVTGNHNLALHTHVSGRGYFKMSVDDFYKQPPNFISRAQGYRAAVDFPETPVTIDPYFLGLWLGDGTSCRQDITTKDPEIVNFLETYAAKLGLRLRRDSKAASNTASTYAICGELGKGNGGSLRPRMVEYNLLNNKHIPSDYLHNSREVRSKVLAGILDTDGYFANECSYEIVQKNERLANDIVWLARSLGFNATVTPATKTCTNAPDGPKPGNYFRIHLNGDLSAIPVLLARKAYKPKVPPRYNMLHRSIEVTPVGVGEFAGFEVDGDHRFLLDDFTVTFNSGKSCWMVKSLYEMVLDNPDDTIGVYLSLDDTIEEAMKRLVSLHTRIDFNDIASPRFTIAKDPAILEQYNEAMQTLRDIPNIILRDATFGRSLRYLRNFFESLRTKYPDKRIVVFVDSLAKITSDTGEDNEEASTGKTNWKAYLASELKYLTTKHKICLVTPTDLRKINGARRPTRDDLKDAAELAYEAQVILLMYNDLKRQRDQAVLKWTPDGSDTVESMLEVINDKNKFTGRTGVIRYRMLGSICDFWENDADEDKEWDAEVLRDLAEKSKKGKQDAA